MSAGNEVRALCATFNEIKLNSKLEYSQTKKKAKKRDTKKEKRQSEKWKGEERKEEQNKA